MARPSKRSPIEAWKALPAEVRFARASAYVRRNGEKLRATYDAVGVGVGFPTRRPSNARRVKPKTTRARLRRTKAGDIRTNEICIRFLVAKKLEGMRPDDPKRVPEYIETVMTFDGVRTRVAIPTDVQGRAPGRMQARRDLQKGIGVRSPGQESVRGSICCEVVTKGASPKRLVLSCHHVLAMSSNSPTFEPVKKATVTDRRASDVIASLYDTATITRKDVDGRLELRGLDAAVAELSTPDRLAMWGMPITRLAKPFEFPKSLRVLTPIDLGPKQPRPSPLLAQFVEVQQYVVLHISKDVDLVVEDAIVYVADTEGGDSGSAVVNAANELVGMHFYKTTDGFCYAMSAWRLFAPGVFAKPIALVS